VNNDIKIASFPYLDASAVYSLISN